MKQLNEKNLSEQNTVQKTEGSNQNLVAGMQSKPGVSFVARRTQILKTIPLKIQTRYQDSKYAQEVIQSLKIQEEMTSKTKESAPSEDQIQEQNEVSPNSSSSSEQQILRMSTHFPDSSLFFDFQR